MFSVNDPELAVEDALCQAPKIHLPHMDSCRQKESRLRKLMQTVLCKSEPNAMIFKSVTINKVSSKPFCFKIFKSVEFVLTEGTLVTTRTDIFLEGNSPSSFRIFLPCRGWTHSIKSTEDLMT